MLLLIKRCEHLCSYMPISGAKCFEWTENLISTCTLANGGQNWGLAAVIGNRVRTCLSWFPQLAHVYSVHGGKKKKLLLFYMSNNFLSID